MGTGGTLGGTLIVREMISNANSEFRDRTRLALEEIQKLKKFTDGDLESLGLDKLHVLQVKKLAHEAEGAYKALESQFLNHKYTVGVVRLTASSDEEECVEETDSLERGLRELNRLIDGRALDPENFVRDFSRKCKMLTTVCRDMAPEARTTPKLRAAEKKFEEEERVAAALLASERSSSSAPQWTSAPQLTSASPLEDTILTHFSFPFFHYLYGLFLYFF